MDVLQYDHQVFQRLPDLSEAGSAFDHLDGRKIVNNLLTPLFRKYGVEYTFGATLVHRNFDLKEHERLVEYKDTPLPWQANAANVVPNCWLFGRDSIRPYEFKFEKGPSVKWSDENIQQFLFALQSELEKIGAQGLFGLCAYPSNKSRGRVEMTKIRANSNFDPNDAPSGIKFREVAWFFSEELFGDSCKCLCVRGRGGDHEYEGGHRSIRG